MKCFAWIMISALIVLGIKGSEYCMSLDPKPFRLYATKTAYDTVRDQGAAEDETIPDLLCEEDRESLRNWVPLYDPNEGSTLAPRGWREFNGIGERYTTRVPGLLARPYDSDAYHFQHTDYSGKGDRTLDTARAFVQGVWGSFDEVGFEQSEQPDWLLHFYKFCERYIVEVNDQPDVEHDLFNEGPYMSAVLRRMETKLGLAAASLTYDVADLIYESCRMEYLVQDGVAPWCVALTPEDVTVFEYSQDLSYYWRTSYPYDVSYQQACTLVTDMVDKFQEAMNDSGGLVSGRFGHSQTLNSFFTILGLFFDSEPLTAINFEEMSSRNWRVSLNTPMGSNAAFILYQCEAAPTYRLKTFVNEKPVTLPQCTEPVCDLDDVMSAWGPIAENCDIEEIC